MQKVKDAPAKASPEKAAKPSSQSEGEGEGRDWSKTLFLPKTDFPMKAGLQNLEPRLLERWEQMKLFERLRKEVKGRVILGPGDGYNQPADGSAGAVTWLVLKHPYDGRIGCLRSVANGKSTGKLTRVSHYVPCPGSS